MVSEKNNSKKADYLKGFGINLFILFSGGVAEWLNKGQGISIPGWPMNAFIGISFAFILVFLHFFYSDLDIVKWLSRVPASISSIVLFTFLTLVLGLTQQNNPDAADFLKKTGLNHIQGSFIFLLSGMYLLTTLGLVMLRRLNKFSFKNLGFFLNHFGLWLIVLAGSLGAGDLQRIQIYVNEDQTVWYGYDDRQQAQELPFNLKLIDFDISYYSPKLAYIDSKTMKYPEGVENNLIMIEEGMKELIGAWEIKVESFYPSASEDSLGNYFPSSDTFAFPLAKIVAVNQQSNDRKSGFISSGSLTKSPVLLKLDERYSLGMTQPEPLEYSSLLQITNKNGIADTTKLVVNKPVKIEGWNLYQLSYDERLGKWSRLSIIEGIKDPWLVIIYIGIFMVIGGSLYLFTIGKKPREE